MVLKGDIGRLEINVLKRINSETNDYWDDNWLQSEIRIDVPGFKVFYGFNLRVDDLQRFYKGLITLKNSNSRKVEFTTMEEGLYLYLNIENNGVVNCKGKANNENGNSLDFKLQSDMATLDIFIGDLETTLRFYPLIGNLEQ